MEFHSLNLSLTPAEVQSWLISKSQNAVVKVAAFGGGEDEFRLTIEYKGLAVPMHFKFISAELALVHLELISLPAILSMLPFLFPISKNGIKLQGRDIWIDLLTLSQGRIRKLNLQELKIQPQTITIKLLDLELTLQD